MINRLDQDAKLFRPVSMIKWFLSLSRAIISSFARTDRERKREQPRKLVTRFQPTSIHRSFPSSRGEKRRGEEGQSIVRLEISRSIAISFVGECEKKTIVTFFCSRSTENSASLPIGITSWKIDKTQVHEARESKARLTGLGLEKKPEAPRNNEIEPPLF